MMLALVKSMPEHRDQCLDFMRQVVESAFEIDMRCNKLSWLKKCICDEYRELSASLRRPSKCRLLCVEPVVFGLVEFVFDLLDHYGVRMNKATLPITLKENMTKYATEIIRELFRVGSFCQNLLLILHFIFILCRLIMMSLI